MMRRRDEADGDEGEMQRVPWVRQRPLYFLCRDASIGRARDRANRVPLVRGALAVCVCCCCACASVCVSVCVFVCVCVCEDVSLRRRFQ